MQTHIATTPFGRRPMTLAMIASQTAAKQVQDGVEVQKWAVFQHVREARDAIGATDRSLAILNALLSFHRETGLRAGGELIVWPSNEQLMARANGMSPTTLRRHLAVLVDCGLVIRRDSPNGKRYARKGRGGEVEQAYGFDLSPLVARAQEFAGLAEAVHVEKKAFRVAREELTLLRRDIVKMIETAVEVGVPGNWCQVRQAYEQIMSRLPRSAPRLVVETIRDDLHMLWIDVREALEFFMESANPDANESQSGAHIHDSNPDSVSESELGLGDKKEKGTAAAEGEKVSALPIRELPLGIVLDACPAVLDLADGRAIEQWRDFLAAAELVRSMLGVSPSAWREAQEAMGEREAAITVAAIYQRSDGIRSAGGYLRALTERARNSKFSPWPMVLALVRAKLDRQSRCLQRTLVEPSSADAAGEGKSYAISDRLQKNLARPRN